jgi:hypothetical protein
MFHFLDTTNVVLSSLILFALMMEAMYSSETYVLTRAIWLYIEDDGIHHNRRRESLKSYIHSCVYMYICKRHAVAQLVVSLRYKLEGHGFEGRCILFIFPVFIHIY